MTKLSVNINKIATLRNSRGGDTPNLLKVAQDIEELSVHRELRLSKTRRKTYQIQRRLRSFVNCENRIQY